ncbi:hypothetical protein C8F01DRAFT_1101733 [Mycena amicta]|nr:hypothetical protein C8F01DRAFT_1101733 [Mycena amicta]
MTRVQRNKITAKKSSGGSRPKKILSSTASSSSATGSPPKKARISANSNTAEAQPTYPANSGIGLKPAHAVSPPDGPLIRKRKRADTVVHPEPSLVPTPELNIFTGGKLDIYAMSLTTLREALQPATSSRLNYTAFLRVIHEKQNQAHDNLKSGEVDIMIAFSASAVYGQGRMSSTMDGFSESTTGAKDQNDRTPYPIGLTAIQHVDALTFTPAEEDHFWPAVPKVSAGLYGVMKLLENSSGIKNVKGIFKMTTEPIYASGNDVVYAGFATLKVQHGHGPEMGGDPSSTGVFAFWAVPAKERTITLSGPGVASTSTGSRAVLTKQRTMKAIPLSGPGVTSTSASASASAVMPIPAIASGSSERISRRSADVHDHDGPAWYFGTRVAFGFNSYESLFLSDDDDDDEDEEGEDSRCHGYSYWM